MLDQFVTGLVLGVVFMGFSLTVYELLTWLFPINEEEE